MNRILLILPALLAALFAARVSLGQCSADAEGSCYEPNGSPGCHTTECCDEVCAADSYCCENDWDQACVKYANELCEGLACPGMQPCDTLSDTPGCDDPTCCRLVCDHDWFCCWIEWDEQCIATQQTLCGPDPCELVIPEGTPTEEEPCYQRTNDGCNRFDRLFGQLDCGMSITGTSTTDTPRDTDWYRIDLTAPTLVRWTISTEFPAQAVLVSGTCEGPTVAREIVESSHCGTVTIEQLLFPGEHALVLSPGIGFASIHDGITCDLEDPEDPPEEGDPPVEPSFYGLRYLIDVECESAGLPGDLNGDGLIDGADLLIVLAAWGTAGPAGDLDGNGIVDGADVLIVLGSWTV